MPVVRYRGHEIECEPGAVLRDVLREAGVAPHNGRAGALNCRGHGTCGTCAVQIEPADAVSGPDTRERVRLSAPPHDPDAGLRLACQATVIDDLRVTKYPGFWGHHADRPPVHGPEGDEPGG
jgi:ferredoxin